MENPMRFGWLMTVVFTISALAGCTAREPTAYAPGRQARPPQDQSYLDPGPAPSRGGGPNYVRDNLRGASNTGDRFRSDLLPGVP